MSQDKMTISNVRVSVFATCNTCRHWRPFETISAKGSDAVGGCASVAQGATKRKLGLCGAIGNEDDFHDEEPVGRDLAQATDLSGFAALRTAPNFGCVLHSVKLEEPT